jgi:type IV pilus assembly protein PilM
MSPAQGRKSVGLEIDSGVIRAVELSGSAASPRLNGMASIALPPGAVEEGMIVNPDEVSGALNQLWKSGDIKHRRVLLGVSNQGVLVRYTTIPKVPKDKMDNVIRFHAQELLPIPLESVVMDYMVIGERDEEEKTQLEILLVAARLDMLNSFMSALDQASLEPVDVDVSTLALMQVLPDAAKDRTVTVVNVANGLSNILVSVNNTPKLARLVSVKIKDLAEQTGLSLENALQEAVRHDYYKSWLRNLVSETRSSLTYFQNQSNSSNIEAIILNGRGARLPGIAAALEGSLGLPVKIINPLSGLQNAGRFTAGKGIEAVDYAICAGLARRGLEGS